MKVLLRSTALASALAFTLPMAAMAGDASKVQADFQTGTSAEYSADAAAGAGTSTDVDLMADVEQLRLLDQIGEVEIVEVANAEEAVQLSADASGSPDADAGASAALESDTGATVDPSATAESGVDAEASGATGATTLPDATADAGAGAEAGTEAEIAAGESSMDPSFDSGASGAADGEVSATFLEDALSQIPEVDAALTESGASPDDIVAIDIATNGDVTLYVRGA